MKFALALIAATCWISVGHAQTYNYSCKPCIFPSVINNGSIGCDADEKAYPLRVDESKNILEWRGRKYGLTVASADQPNGCAKYGWHAKGHGVNFTFCTATQGYGAIEDKDGSTRVQCDLRR